MVETIISVHRNTVSVDVFVRETLTNSQNFRLRRAGVPWVGVPWGFQNPQKRGRGPPEHKRECGRPNLYFRIQPKTPDTVTCAGRQTTR